MNTSEQVWHQYQARLRAFVKSKVADDAAADDILQNLFLKIHAGLASLRDETRLESWLYRLARNTIADHFRSQRPSAELPERLPQPPSDTGEQARQELSACLPPLIQRLPAIYREAVVLSDLDGKTQREVAEVQGISLSGAKSRVQRGRALLKRMLDECCWFEVDRGGRIYGYEAKCEACSVCRDRLRPF